MDFAPWGAKSDARYPTRQGGGLSFGGFFSMERWIRCRSVRKRSAPFQRRCLAHSLGWEVLAQLSLSDGHSVVRSKKKPVHRRTNPSGSFPLAGVLVWLSMYWLKSRIQFALCGSFSLTYRTVVCQYTFERFSISLFVIHKITLHIQFPQSITSQNLPQIAHHTVPANFQKQQASNHIVLQDKDALSVSAHIFAA